ncbi:MAG: DUF1127 domain-containing protein [Maritimibacter harenae]|jgi:uncharacterized protein YjiS (DUF1127 family)|nr:DUF1127 domain-containing protein [Maritimibacter harenae]
MAIEATTHGPADLMTRVAHLTADLWVALKRRHAERETRRILASLSDAQLDDIGVMRGDLLR